MQERIHAILLAGVHQWRPSIFERWVPRTLVPIANRPLIEYPLEWLTQSSVPTVQLCANSDTAALRQHFDTSTPSSIAIRYYEDQMPRGPAGCIADAAKGCDEQTFLVVDATIIPHDIDLSAILNTHAAAGAAMTVVTCAAGESQGRPAGMAPVGIFVVSRSALLHVNPKGYQDLKEMLIPRLYDAGARVVAHQVAASQLRVGGAASCFMATHAVLLRMLGGEPLPAGYRIDGTAIIHETAEVAPSARLVGPVMVGPEARIDSDATIVGPTCVGRECVIEEGAQVCRSLLWDFAGVSAHAFVDQCILTYGAAVGSGRRLSRRIQHRTAKPRFSIFRR